MVKTIITTFGTDECKVYYHPGAKYPWEARIAGFKPFPAMRNGETLEILCRTLRAYHRADEAAITEKNALLKLNDFADTCFQAGGA